MTPAVMSAQDFDESTTYRNQDKISEKRISIMEFDKFCRSYFRDGRSKYLRFGQAFLNEKYPTDVNPKLFYCKWLDESITLIHQHYIETT